MSKTVLFKTILFGISTQLNDKTVPFQTIQFSISIKVLILKQFYFNFSKNAQFSSIWPIDRTLSGATTPDQSGPGSDGNEGYSAFPKAPALQEPHHLIV